ncbi:MAG: MFS transporter [Acetobacteraceae bacterium]|nr:MFS transporter [Acetobacteraceae bacterium]
MRAVAGEGTGGGGDGGGRGAGSSGPARALVFLAHNRGLALVCGAEALLSLGDNVAFIAISWLVLKLTGLSLAMAGILVCMTLPGLVLLSVGGLASDRLARRAVMVSALLVKAPFYLAAAIAVLAGRQAMGWVFALALAHGVCNAFYLPASRALIADMVPPAGLMRANSLLEVAKGTMSPLGSLLGGALVGTLGTGSAFLLDGVALACAAALLALLPPARRAAEAARARRPGLLAQMREGLACAGRDIRLVLLFLLMALCNFSLGGPVDAVLPRLAQEVLGSGPEGYAGLYSALGFGSLGAALGLSAVGQRVRRRGLVALFSVTVMGLGVALLPVSGSVAAGVALMAVVGVTVVVVRVAAVTFIQTLVDEGLRGRVLGLMYTAAVTLSPAAYPAFAALSDALSPSLAFVAGGAIMTLYGLGGLAVPAIRRLD